MPPLAESLQIDSTGITAYTDLSSNTKKSRLSFTNDTAITLENGSAQVIRLTGLATPTSDADAVTKKYVDSIANGLRVKAPCRVVGFQNIASLQSTLISGYVIDDITLVAGNRVLLVAQTNKVENGIWTVSATGAPTRPLDFATSSSASGSYVFIDEGTLYRDRAYACITNSGSDIVDTNSLDWVQFAARPTAYAGTGLVTGDLETLNVNSAVIPYLSMVNTFTGNLNTFTNGISTPSVVGLQTNMNATVDTAASIGYVQNRLNTFSYKPSVNAVSTSDISNPETTLSVGYTMDGVLLALDHRVLLKNQSNAVENGIYQILAGGSIRVTDLKVGDSALGSIVLSISGEVNGDQVFICKNDRDAVVGTHPLIFGNLVTQSDGLAGKGIISNGTSLDVNVDNSTLEILGDTVSIKTAGVTNAYIADTTIENAKLVNSALAVNVSRGLNTTQSNLPLGSSTTVSIDHTVIPDLAAQNTFTGASNTFTQNVTVNDKLDVTNLVTTQRVTGLSTTQITNPTDAVNLEYIRSLPQKLGARVAAESNVDLLNVLIGTTTVDGVTLQENDRILLLGQTNSTENGVWIVGSPVVRSVDMAIGMTAAGVVIVVTEGLKLGDRIFMCTNSKGQDTIGTHALSFAVVGHSLQQLAGVGLASNSSSMMLDVTTDNVTLQVNQNDAVEVKNSGITNAKIADSTIENIKLVNKTVTVNTATGSGLLGGAAVPLGGNTSLSVDSTTIPYLAYANNFTNSNSFTGQVSISNTTNATSQSSGALVVSGGIGITGDIFCQNTYNMSDNNLKNIVFHLSEMNPLETIEKIEGVIYTWNDHAENQKHNRVGQPAVGVIAQDVQKATPLAVVEDAETKLLAVEYTRLVPYLIEGVKCLKRKCSDLETEIQQMKQQKTL